MMRVALGLMMASLLGCGREPPVDDDGDGIGTVYTYVLSTMDNSDPSTGFNLDGLVSDGSTGACSDQPDFASGGRVGIDNSLASGVGVPLEPPTYLAELVEPRIAAGEFLVLMELTDVHSITSDARVGVRIYFGSAAAPVALEDGLIAPGQTFQQVGADLANVTAVIDVGMLSFELPTFPLGLAPSATGAVAVLHDVHVRARLDPAGQYVTGAIGGSIPADEIVAYSGVSLEELRGGFLDLEPDPSDDRICGAMSVGISFAMVSSVPE